MVFAIGGYFHLVLGNTESDESDGIVIAETKRSRVNYRRDWEMFRRPAIRRGAAEFDTV
jgi:hypothetical protein